ncbi:carbohydrate-binding domain-containing protein [Enterococcus sp. LJL128]
MKKIATKLSVLTGLLVLFAGCQKNEIETSQTISQANTISSETEQENTQNSADITEMTNATISETKYGKYSEEDFDESYSEANATMIKMTGTQSTITGSGASESNQVITISAGGTYILSGEYTGQIKVSANQGTVKLVLNGVTITNDTSAAIYVEQAEKVITTLAEGTQNRLTDGSEYIYGTADETDPNAAFFSKDDLTINGSGTLTVSGNYNNGIQSKDDLVITNGTIKVTAKNNGIKGKDSVSIAGGTFIIETAEGDGIQADNATEAEKGWVGIDGGNFELNAANDGIQAETTLSIKTSTMSIQTGTGETFDEIASYKGLKASGTIVIDEGTYKLTTADDSIHSNADVIINNGSFELSSGDDGIHADTDLTINNGTIKVAESYEGLEGATVTINDGIIEVHATDDGINSAGGSEGDSGAFGGDQFSGGDPNSGGDSSYYLEINGGTIYVEAEGDGVDSNGDIRMNGGTLLVNGPVNGGNGALDYEGTFSMEGGTLLASGSSGMALGTSDSSSQAAVSIYFDTTQAADTLIHLQDSEGNQLATFQPTKEFSHLVVSTPQLSSGKELTIYSGGTSSGTSEFGLYQDGTYEGGTQIGTLTLSGQMTSVSQDGSAVSENQMGGGLGGGRW